MSARLTKDYRAATALAVLLLIGRLAGDDAPPANGTLPALHVKQGYGVKGLVLWLAADGGVTSDAQGQVSKMVDRTGNFTLTSTGGNQGPTLIPAILNGHPVLRFNSNQSLYSPYNFGNALDHAMTFIVVAMTKGADLEQFSLYFGQNASPGNNRAMAVLGGKEIFDGQYAACIGPPALLNVFVAQGASINPTLTRATFYRNGKKIGTAGLDPSDPKPFLEVSDGVTLGAATDPVRGWNGDIAEALVYDRQLTPAEMQTLWTALSAKYALPQTPAPSASTPTPSTGTSP